MYLNGTEFYFKLFFPQTACADNYPLFVLRSVLGMQLRRMCCIAMNQKSDDERSPYEKCAFCRYNAGCVYSVIFETIVPRDNPVLAGTERASHPFAFTRNTKFTFRQRTLEEFGFSIALFGRASDYLPYIYAAFLRAGRTGIFKDRSPFIIKELKCNGSSLLLDEDNIDTDIPHWKISCDTSLAAVSGEVLVELLSPLRFKTNGHYTTDFTAADFFRALYRRAKTLCGLYGDGKAEPYDAPASAVEITDRNLRWHDYSHYSSRQKNAMELGGVTGSFKLSGTFSAMEQFLLDMAEKCNAGKNTNFGLGQMKVWKNLSG